LNSSWKTLFTVLSSPEKFGRQNPHPALESFLSDPFVLQLLAQPYSPYSSSKTQAKSSFETKTAAINITPTTKGRYDISEIKEDALWLSKEAEIDELSALRLVVLEYQSRSPAQLLCDFSEEEALSLQEAAGNGPETLSMVPIATLSSGKPEAFHSQDSRRIRILHLYLAERQYLVKCTASLLQAGLDSIRNNGEGESADGTSSRQEDKRRWVEDIGGRVLKTVRQGGKTIQQFLINSIGSLKASFGGLDKGSGWFKQQGGQEDLEIEWLRSALIEAVHTMEIIFSVLDFQNSLPSSESVTEWFKFVATFGFFDQFNSVCNFEDCLAVDANIMCSHTPLFSR
jgi:nuclear pore complex protein Nup188